MKTIKEMMEEAFQTNIEHGFDPSQVELPTAVALMHSELSEALEEYRSGRPLYYYSHQFEVNPAKPEGIGAEYADVIIRIMSDSHARGIDLEKAITEKMAYNKTRPFKHGGKKV